MKIIKMDKYTFNTTLENFLSNNGPIKELNSDNETWTLSKPISITRVSFHIYDYIKEKSLQHPYKSSIFFCDENLKKLYNITDNSIEKEFWTIKDMVKSHVKRLT